MEKELKVDMEGNSPVYCEGREVIVSPSECLGEVLRPAHAH